MTHKDKSTICITLYSSSSTGWWTTRSELEVIPTRTKNLHRRWINWIPGQCHLFDFISIKQLPSVFFGEATATWMLATPTISSITFFFLANCAAAPLLTSSSAAQVRSLHRPSDSAPMQVNAGQEDGPTSHDVGHAGPPIEQKTPSPRSGSRNFFYSPILRSKISKRRKLNVRIQNLLKYSTKTSI